MPQWTFSSATTENLNLKQDNMMTGMKVIVAAFTLLISVFFIPSLIAAKNIGNVNISISGTVVATASCKISGSNPIKVDYGDVYISEIAGDNYRKQVVYDVSCQGDANGKNIQLEITGNSAVFDGNLLRTDADGLGIKLLRNGSQMQLNQWYDLDPVNPPRIESVLVKQKGATFMNGQEFNAGATLKVAYN
ncbi:TPA: fimbrial protein [Klebsiella aerogenes]|nr:fimbrial protein [Klebsiella aerogenes]